MNNDQFNIVTLFNPLPEPFPVEYNGEKHKIIQPGKAVRVVKMIAGDSNNGAIKHLIDRLMRNEGKNKNDPEGRAAWYEKVVLGSEVSDVYKAMTPEDEAVRRSNELDIEKPQWKFDPMTGQPIQPENPPQDVNPQYAPRESITPANVDTSKIEVQEDAPMSNPNIPTTPPPHPDAETNNILNNIRNNAEARELKPVELNEETPQVPEKADPNREVTREILISFARDQLQMDVNDTKTREMLDTTPIEQLRKDLNYDALAE